MTANVRRLNLIKGDRYENHAFNLNKNFNFKTEVISQEKKSFFDISKFE